MMEAEHSPDALRSAVQLACQSQNVSQIVTGRQQVLAMPRAWVLERIERLAGEVLNLTADSWEYRRLLELAEQLDAGLVRQLLPMGMDNNDPDMRETAEDFREKLV